MNEIIKKVREQGVLADSILMFAGFAFIGILVLIIFYYLIAIIVNMLRKQGH